MTLTDLRKRLPFWKQVLNLSNWTITLKKGTKQNMGPDIIGLNRFSPEDEASDIYLLPGVGEDTLVHELLHLVFDGHKALETPYSAMHERALNRTAKALVELANKEGQ